jgi:hypothetical protein
MTTWYSREMTVTTVEWRIPANPPWGACWTEVYNVIDMAIAEYQDMKHSSNTPSDDAIGVHPEDDVIVVSYVKDSKE